MLLWGRYNLNKVKKVVSINKAQLKKKKDIPIGPILVIVTLMEALEVVVGGQKVAKVVKGRKDPPTSCNDWLVVFGGGMEVSEVVVGGREVVRLWKATNELRWLVGGGWWLRDGGGGEISLFHKTWLQQKKYIPMSQTTLIVIAASHPGDPIPPWPFKI